MGLMRNTKRWYCPITHGEFQSRKKYRAHLRELVRARLRHPRSTAARRAYHGVWHRERDKIADFDELSQFFIDNIELLVNLNLFPTDAEGRRRNLNVDISIFDMKWSRRVHVQDRWVSGWHGTMVVKINSSDFFAGHLFKNSRIFLNDGVVVRGRFHFKLTVPDRSFPNIAFSARMKGLIDPNKKEIL